MARFVILMLFACLFCNQMSLMKAESPCNFHGVAECWNDILSKYCENGVCEENPDYCQDKELLSECFQVNCDIQDKRELTWVTLFTGVCAKPNVVQTVSEED